MVYFQPVYLSSKLYDVSTNAEFIKATQNTCARLFRGVHRSSEEFRGVQRSSEEFRDATAVVTKEEVIES